MDIEKLENEAETLLKGLIEKYSIKEKYTELIYHYSSVYIHKDYKQKRIRLLGIKEEYIIDDNGDMQRIGKKKTVQLYVLSKRMIQTLPKDAVFDISRDLSVFTYQFTLLKQIEKLKATISMESILVPGNAMSIEDYERLKN